MNEKYEVQNIIKFWNKFRNKKIHLFGRKYRFLINIRNGTLPHLLGLQYINSSSNKLIGLDLYNYIKNNNLSDDKIYALINKNNPTKLMFVKKRIETFISFWENIENSYIVEKTTQFSHIKSKLLLVQSDKSSFLQLGLKQIKNKKYVLETYFVELDDKYFSNSKSMDKVIEIEETTNKGISKPFSFKNEKQVLANVLNKQKNEEQEWKDNDKFFNVNRKIFYDQNGLWKKIIVSYNNIKKISYYYNNGILKKTVTLKNDILVGKIKKYTSLGYLITDSHEYPNPLEKKKSKKLKIKKKKKNKKEKENLV